MPQRPKDVECSEFLEFRGLVDGAFRIWERETPAPEILASFDVRITSAYAEGVTTKFNVIKRTGYGFRNFARLRERVLVPRGDSSSAVDSLRSGSSRCDSRASGSANHVSRQ